MASPSDKAQNAYIDNDLTFNVNGTAYDNVTGFKFVDRLNQLPYFEMQFVDVKTSNTDILVNKDVMLLAGEVLLFPKMTIRKRKPKSHLFLDISGYAAAENNMLDILTDTTAAADSDSQAGRPQYIGVDIDTIVSEQIADVSGVTVNINNLPTPITIRGENDNVLSLLAGVSTVGKAEWWSSYGDVTADYPYSSNYFNMAQKRRSGRGGSIYATDGNTLMLFHCNTGSGTTLVDSSGNSDDGAFKGAGEPAWSTDSKFGAYCLHFDGSNDYVNAGTALNTETAYSVEMWFKLDADFDSDNATDQYLCSNFGATVKGLELYLDASDGRMLYQVSGVDTIHSDQVAWNNTTWYHVVITGSSAGMKMYINGIEQNETSTSDASDIDDSDNLYIGCKDDLTASFDGKLDEIRVSDSVRTTFSSTEEFNISGTSQNINPTSREQDWDSMANIVKVFGYGDGINQLESYNFHATSVRTFLTAALTATGTTATVNNASAFDATGNVWIGCEKCAYTGKTATSFTGLTRGGAFVGNVSAAYAHKARSPVYDAQYTAAASQSTGNGSSINSNGSKSKSFTDKTVVDQSSLDIMTEGILNERKGITTSYDPPERILFEPVDYTNFLRNVQTGDEIKITDSDAGLSGYYRVYGIKLENKEGLVTTEVEVSNTTLNLTSEIAKSTDAQTNLSKYMQGATNIFVVNETDNVEESTDIVIDDFEDNWDHWTCNRGDALVGVQEAVIVHDGSSSVKLGIDASKSGKDYARWNNITDTHDISSYVGTSSGDPKTGIIKFWVYFNTTDYLLNSNSTLGLVFGHNISNYYLYVIPYSEISSSADGSWYQIVINLTDWDQTNGTVDWTAIDFIRIGIYSVVSNTHDYIMYVDQMVLDGASVGESGPVDLFFQIPNDTIAINNIKLSYRNEKPRVWSNISANNSLTSQQTAATDDSVALDETTTNWQDVTTIGSSDSHFTSVYSAIALANYDYGTTVTIKYFNWRLYDGTTYYPDSSGVRETAGGKRDHTHGGGTGPVDPNVTWIAGHGMFLLAPKSTDGATWKLQVKINSTTNLNTCTAMYSYQSISNHTHDISYDIVEKPYTTSDMRIFTTDDSDGTPVWTERTTDIETDLGAALNAADEEVENDIDITEYFSGTGWKGVRIVTDGNSRHRAQIMGKVYIDSRTKS